MCVEEPHEAHGGTLMNIRMQELETMTEQELRDWFENISERELLAQLDAMAEPERLALLEKIPEEIRCNMGFLSDQEIAFQAARTRYNTSWPKATDFGGFSGKYGQQYKDWLEAYCPEEFWELVCRGDLALLCKEKDVEVGDFIDDTVKALLVNNPAPDKNQVLEYVGHMNALKDQAEEMAEPLMFGGCQRGELGIPKMARPVATRGRAKNRFFDGTQEEWEALEHDADSTPAHEFTLIEEGEESPF